ncbi:hypothetical protein LBC_12620 [Campylobacter sp. 19-13652]|nr:hypothetical protein LBC_12620 [Campylobacter sp. 19-13652]
MARQMLALCSDAGSIFVVNDDVDFAFKIGAKAVHVGRDDFSLKYAKKVLGDDAFVGVSCYDSLELAKKAQDDGASYVAFGSMFASKTKPAAPICELEILTKAKQTLDIPVCAIGGIDAKNIGLVAKSGVDYISVVSALYTPNDIRSNVSNLNRALKI